MRELAATLDLSARSTGPLVTLTWVRRAEMSRRERNRAEKLGGVPIEPGFAEHVARLWLREDGLGPGWSVWRGR